MRMMSKCQHNTGFGSLVLAVVGGSVEGGVSIGGGCGSVMQGQESCEVFVLAAIMHGVAGDDHR